MTRLGRAILFVKDLERMTRFYQETLGIARGVDPEGNVFQVARD
jgi:catechol-2,3-dioxygenase